MGKKRVLLAFVEAVYFIHKQQGFPPLGLFAIAGPLHHFADFFHPAKYGRQGFIGKLANIGQQPGKGGFAHPRRPPKDHGVQLALFYGPAQGFAGTNEVLLAYVVIKVSWRHAIGQRLETVFSLKKAVLHQSPSRITSTSSVYCCRKARRSMSSFIRILST